MGSRKFVIQFTEQFLLDFDSVFNYICFDLKNLHAAQNLYKKLIYRLNQVRIFPYIYPIYTTNSTNFIWHKMRVENYAIFYTVDKNIIKVARMIYSRRNLEELFLEEAKEVYIV